MICVRCGAPNASGVKTCSVCMTPLAVERPARRSDDPIRRCVRLRDVTDGRFLGVASAAVGVEIDGPLAATSLVVTFRNDLDVPIEGDLVFPLPPSAALRKLHVSVGSREIEANIRPRDRARAEYVRALESGKTAALAETEGEDMAQLRVAPIGPGEDVVVSLSVLQALLPTDSGHRLIVPLTYMPRFVEDGTALKDTERAALDRPRPATLEARAAIEVRIAHRPDVAPRVRCVSHATTTKTSGRTTTVTVEQAPLDRDFSLDVDDRPAGASSTLWVRHCPGDGPDESGPATVVAIVPPAFADEGPTIPRSVTFLIDRSGSMDGGPMASAIRAVRGCLRALGPEDRFNVIAFDDALEVLADRPLAFDDATLAAADTFVQAITARGGTAASEAVAAALRDVQADVKSIAMRAPEGPRADPAASRLRIVVFMTDGDVAGAEQVLQAAKEALVDTRVHVVGIGDAVNHAMLSALATAGGGAYIPVSTDEDLERAIARLKNATNAPLWSSVKISVEHEGDRRAAKDLEPRGPVDLFGGQATLIAFRGAVSSGDRLVVEGFGPKGEASRLVETLQPSESSLGADVAHTAWALAKNRRLTYRFDEDDDETLEALGSAFGIVNRRVALVGVHADRRDLPIEGSIAVTLPLPRNIENSFSTMSMALPVPPMGGRPMQAGGYGAPGMGMGMGMGMAPPAPPPPMMGAPPPAMIGALSPPMMAAPPPMMAPPPPAMVVPPPAATLSMLDDVDDGPPVSQGFGLAAPPPRVAPPMRSEPPPPPRVDDTSAVDLTNDEAGLRSLILLSRADGLFEGDLALTLACVAAFVSHGHGHREGSFRAELRRTLATLKAKLPTLRGDELAFAVLTIAILNRAAGTPASSGVEPSAAFDALGASVTAALDGITPGDPAATSAALSATLLAAPEAWQTPRAAQVARAFQLVRG